MSLHRLAVGYKPRALTILQAEHFFTFRFSVQTTQQSLKSPLKRKSKDKNHQMFDQTIYQMFLISFTSTPQIYVKGELQLVRDYGLLNDFSVVIGAENRPKLLFLLCNFLLLYFLLCNYLITYRFT